MKTICSILGLALACSCFGQVSCPSFGGFQNDFAPENWFFNWDGSVNENSLSVELNVLPGFFEDPSYVPSYAQIIAPYPCNVSFSYDLTCTSGSECMPWQLFIFSSTDSSYSLFQTGFDTFTSFADGMSFNLNTGDFLQFLIVYGDIPSSPVELDCGGNGLLTISNFEVYPTCIEGCTYPSAGNYNPEAVIDDGSCQFAGCTDPEASNYAPLANVDDGTCTYFLPADINEDGSVNTADILALLGAFGL